MHNGSSEFRKRYQVGPQPEALLACKAFELLLNASFDFEQVLDHLELQFTNEEHTTPYSSIICWILWNSVLRKQHFLDEYYAAPKRGVGYTIIFVGRAAPQDLCNWLNCIKEALQNQWPYKLLPFWIANTRADKSLGYTRDEWRETRRRAFKDEEAEDAPARVLIVPFQHGGRYRFNYFVEAIDHALAQSEVLKEDNLEICELYFQNTDETVQTGDNQDIVDDFDFY